MGVLGRLMLVCFPLFLLSSSLVFMVTRPERADPMRRSGTRKGFSCSELIGVSM